MSNIQNDFFEKGGGKKFLRRMMNWSLSIVGVDIGAGFIKAVEISFAGKRPLLKAIGIIEMPDYIVQEGRVSDFKALPELLRKIWLDGGFTCRSAITAIDARVVFARELAFPLMSKDELKVAVKWEMGQYVPYEENSYYYDFDVIEADSNQSGNGGKCKVFLAAAPMKMVDDISAALKRARFKIRAVDLESLALAAFGGGWNGVNVIVDVGCFHSQIVAVANSNPVLSRVITQGAQHLKNPFEAKIQTEVEGFGVDLSNEIRRTVGYLPPQYRPQFQNIYLTGGGARIDNLVTIIANEFSEIPVNILNPLAGMDISLEIDQNYLNEMAPQFTVAVGLAMRGGRYD